MPSQWSAPSCKWTGTGCSWQSRADEARRRANSSLSRTLEMVNRLEIGLWFAGRELSRPSFFSNGSTVLYRAGNVPVCSDRLASLAMAGVTTWAHDLSSLHGNTSSGDDLGDIVDSSFRTSSMVTGSKDGSLGPRCRRIANVRQPKA